MCTYTSRLAPVALYTRDGTNEREEHFAHRVLSERSILPSLFFSFLLHTITYSLSLSPRRTRIKASLLARRSYGVECIVDWVLRCGAWDFANYTILLNIHGR